MPFNGSGVFQRVRNWVADATAGIKIRADYHDAEDDGFAAGLTNCITKDGQTIVTQNIPWNSKRITGLADPINDQDAATKKYTDTKIAAGGEFTGDLEIDKDNPSLILDKNASGQSSSVIGRMDGKNRWIMRLGNDDPETGSNAGSNFDLLRYDDAGTLLKVAMTINRAGGGMTVNGDLYSVRSATEGVIFLGTSGNYLHWTGSFYHMPSGKLTLGGQGASGNDAVTWDQLATKQPNLGFTPVQQGGGAYQQGNKVYIGWDNSNLRAQVDGLDLGTFVFGGSVIKNVRWLHAGASYPPGTQSGVWQDPFPNSVIYLYVTSGGTVIAGFQHKYFQAFTTSWFTVGF